MSERVRFEQLRDLAGELVSPAPHAVQLDRQLGDHPSCHGFGGHGDGLGVQGRDHGVGERGREAGLERFRIVRPMRPRPAFASAAGEG